MRSRRPRGSRPADGSSKTRTDGSIVRTVASATRLRCPSDSRWGSRRSNPLMPTAARARSTRSWISSVGHAHVDRSEGDILEHGRAEQLIVGVLEHEPDLGADPLDGRSIDRACRRSGRSRGSACGCRSGGASACSCRRRSGRRGRPSRRGRCAGRRRGGPRTHPGRRNGGARRRPSARRRPRSSIRRLRGAAGRARGRGRGRGLPPRRAHGRARVGRRRSSQRRGSRAGPRARTPRDQEARTANDGQGAPRSAAVPAGSGTRHRTRAPASRRRSARCVRTSEGRASRPSSRSRSPASGCRRRRARPDRRPSGMPWPGSSGSASSPRTPR